MASRGLVLRHMAKVLASEEPKPDALKPNQMQLYSFYHPGLEAGDYEIFAQQDIAVQTASGKQALTVINTKKGSNANQQVKEPQIFEVLKPQFSLDRALINSYYPPNGHQDEGRVLPHVVLSDPHLPWERAAGLTTNMHGEIDEDPNDKNVKRSMVPWVALMVFDIGDLVIPDAETAEKLKIPGFTTADDMAKQTPTGTFSMKVSDYMAAPDDSRVRLENGYTGDPDGLGRLKTSTEAMQAIFPLKTHVKERFSDLESFKYLAHVRHINTVGFPDSGDEEEGLFSVVISPRTGAFDIQQPTTQIVHLVSIEHLDYTLQNLSSWPTTDRLGMISLFSWVYTALPPDPVNFVDTMLGLAKGRQMLRPREQVLDSLHRKAKQSQDNPNAASLLHQRFSLGYTLSRWRAETGEETAAFYRGPFVPQPVPQPPDAQWKDCSNHSKDYQILDPSTGLADLSYSSAWQLGKLLAISDPVFSAALTRFRSRVHESSASQTRMEVNGMPTAAAVMRNLVSSTDELERMVHGHASTSARFRLPIGPKYSRPRPPISIDQPIASSIFDGKILEQVSNLASAGDNVYNEFNTSKPNDSDWVTIHGWVMDKLYLAGIPAHYLVPDPSFLPSEGLRFFYIDDNWLDCLLDGALSVANHLDKDDDYVRRVIKGAINTYLSTEIEDTGIKPQVPKYGFLLRSKIIKAMPDLRITLRWKKPDKRQTVCRYTRWDETTILCLLDRYPEELQELVLAQPSHQQRFSLGYSLTSEVLEFRLIKLYTTNPPDGAWPPSGHNPKFGPNGPIKDNGKSTGNNWFNWITRCMNTRTMAREINQLCQVSGEYSDKVPTSPELALQLNDPTHFLRVVPPAGSTTPSASTQTRRLYVVNTEPDQVPRFEIKSSDSPPTFPSNPPPTFPEYQPDDDDDISIVVASLGKEKVQYLPPQLTAPSRPIPRACVTSNFSKAIETTYSGLKAGIYPSDDEDPFGSSYDNGDTGAASDGEQKKDDQKDTGKKDTDKKDTDKKDTDKKDTEKKDTDKKDTEKKDTEKKDDGQGANNSGATTSNEKKDPAPQFTLAVFPDYRTAQPSTKDDDHKDKPSPPKLPPPKGPKGPKPPGTFPSPTAVSQDFGTNTGGILGDLGTSLDTLLDEFAPTAGETEYIPTQNVFFFDLIFAVRRIKAPTSGLKLKELRIEIPMRPKTPTGGNTTFTVYVEEPLLTPDYTGPGVRMVANQRLVPLATTRPWITGSTLVITMVPRSASADAVLDINSRRLVEAGVRLAEANVDEKVRNQRRVKVRGSDGQTTTATDWGVAKVVLVETYTTGTARSSWNVFKKDVRDLKYDGVLMVPDL